MVEEEKAQKMKRSIRSEMVLNILRHEFKGASDRQLMEIAASFHDSADLILEATSEREGLDFSADFPARFLGGKRGSA